MFSYVDISVNFTLSRYLSDIPHIYYFKGEAIYTKPEDDDSDESGQGLLKEANVIELSKNESESRVVATMNGVLFCGEKASDAGDSIVSLADAISGELEEIATAFFDSNNYLSDDLMDGDIGETLLYFRELQVDKEFRKNGLGLYLMSQALEIVGYNASAAVLKAHPLQFPRGVFSKEAAVNLDVPNGSKSFKAYKKKLENYYSQLGFEKIPKTEMMKLNCLLINDRMTETLLKISC